MINRFRIPKAIQKEPQAPWIAVASVSLTRKAHMPAMNCATPPKIAANGQSVPFVLTPPYAPVRCNATMKVAAANPYRPRTDGAANGCSITRGRANPSSHSLPRSTVTTLRASLVLIVLLPSPSTVPFAGRPYSAGRAPTGSLP
jgi:hypothetical protein